MSYKDDLRGVYWSVVFHLDHFAMAQETKLLSIFNENVMLAKSMVKYEVAKFGTYHLTWHSEVGYDSVHAWCTQAFRKLNFTVWFVEVCCTGGVPLPSSGVPPPVLVSSSGAPPQVRRVMPPQDGSSLKRVRLHTKTRTEPTAVHSEGVAPRGVSPPSGIWLLQKALKIYSGTILNDPVAVRYAAVSQALLLRQTLHSSTYVMGSPGLDEVVIKVVDPEVRVEFLHEVDFLTKLHHPNINKLVDVVRVDGRCAMVFNYGGSDLGMLIHLQQGVSPLPDMSQLIYQLLVVVVYVHAQDIVHSDLKPGNIVVDEHGVLRLIDFGCAFVSYSEYRTKRSYADIEKRCILYGTLPYRAIEVLVGRANFSKPIDVWSIGCILFEMTVCARLFIAKDVSSLVSECFAQLGQQGAVGCLVGCAKWKPSMLVESCGAADFFCRIRNAAVNPCYEDFIYKFLNIDMHLRPTAEQALAYWNVVRPSSDLLA